MLLKVLTRIFPKKLKIATNSFGNVSRIPKPKFPAFLQDLEKKFPIPLEVCSPVFSIFLYFSKKSINSTGSIVVNSCYLFAGF